MTQSLLNKFFMILFLIQMKSIFSFATEKKPKKKVSKIMQYISMGVINMKCSACFIETMLIH